MDLYLNITLSAILPEQESELNISIPTDVQTSLSEMTAVVRELKKLTGLSPEEVNLLEGYLLTVSNVMHAQQVRVNPPAALATQWKEQPITVEHGALEI